MGTISLYEVAHYGHINMDRFALLILTACFVSTCNGFGFGGPVLSYPQYRTVIPRVNSGDLAMRYSRYGNGGVMYFRDPSPSHLRYSLDSYKLKNEEKGFKKKEPTRWDWLNSITQDYDDDNSEDIPETERSSKDFEWYPEANYSIEPKKRGKVKII